MPPLKACIVRRNEDAEFTAELTPSSLRSTGPGGQPKGYHPQPPLLQRGVPAADRSWQPREIWWHAGLALG